MCPAACRTGVSPPPRNEPCEVITANWGLSKIQRKPSVRLAEFTCPFPSRHVPVTTGGDPLVVGRHATMAGRGARIGRGRNEPTPGAHQLPTVHRRLPSGGRHTGSICRGRTGSLRELSRRRAMSAAARHLAAGRTWKPTEAPLWRTGGRRRRVARHDGGTGRATDTDVGRRPSCSHPVVSSGAGPGRAARRSIWWRRRQQRGFAIGSAIPCGRGRRSGRHAIREVAVFPYHDENVTQRTPVVTIAIIAACALAWLVVQGAGATMPLAASVCNYGLIPGELLGTVAAGTSWPMGDNLMCVVDQGPEVSQRVHAHVPARIMDASAGEHVVSVAVRQQHRRFDVAAALRGVLPALRSGGGRAAGHGQSRIGGADGGCLWRHQRGDGRVSRALPARACLHDGAARVSSSRPSPCRPGSC